MEIQCQQHRIPSFPEVKDHLWLFPLRLPTCSTLHETKCSWGSQTCEIDLLGVLWCWLGFRGILTAIFFGHRPRSHFGSKTSNYPLTSGKPNSVGGTPVGRNAISGVLNETDRLPCRILFLDNRWEPSQPGARRRSLDHAVTKHLAWVSARHCEGRKAFSRLGASSKGMPQTLAMTEKDGYPLGFSTALSARDGHIWRTKLSYHSSVPLSS
jgi:hypothetical protein